PDTFSNVSNESPLLLADGNPLLLCCDRLMADNSPYDLPNKGLYWRISIRRRFTSSPRMGMKLAVFQRSRLGCQGANSVNCSGYIFGSPAATNASCAKIAEA